LCESDSSASRYSKEKERKRECGNLTKVGAGNWETHRAPRRRTEYRIKEERSAGKKVTISLANHNRCNVNGDGKKDTAEVGRVTSIVGGGVF